VNETAEPEVNTGNKQRPSLTPSTKNIARKCLVHTEKVLLPYFHIKLDSVKQSVKALRRYGNCLKYVRSKFPGISKAKKVKGDICST
jgi:hypothetical protein